MSDDGMYLYHLGIIDYLQEYNIVKTLENFGKGLISDKTKISAVPANDYATRFFDFMKRNVIKH